MWFGGDYYPEQWDREIVDQDLQLMKELKVTCMTVGVFAWRHLEPEEGKFSFEWLDEIIDRLYENKIDVILATPTTGIPYWLSSKYPEMMHVDSYGRRALNGMREKFCPNSPIYRKYSRRIAGELAKRYGKHPGVKLWHINNEYHFYCYCPECKKKFQDWLKRKYETVESLNKAWNTDFWGHLYSSFVEVEIPGYLSDVKERGIGNRDIACFQGQYLDYMRFMSQSVRECIENEKREIKKYSSIPVTNNFSGLVKTYDYREFAKALDIVSWDNYPSLKTPPYEPAFMHDLVRAMKHKPFLVMEQSPNQPTWESITSVKKPKELGRIAWQGIARGALSSMYFQWRQSVGGVEKFHGAMIPHSGRLDTRMGKELSVLGEQLQMFGDLVKGGERKAKVALLFEWENWWALEGSALHNNTLSYKEQVLRYYRAFYEMGIPVDIVDEQECMKKDYKFIVAPCHYLCSSEYSSWVENFVKEGGTFLTTFLSGICDRNDKVLLGGYPGAFRTVLGLWIEEIEGLYPDAKNQIMERGGDSWDCGEICDLICIETADVLGTYGKEFYQGRPCFTKNCFGQGQAFYVGTSPEYGFVKKILKDICREEGISIMEIPKDIEYVETEKEETRIVFLLNHGIHPREIKLEGKWKTLMGHGEVENSILLEGGTYEILMTNR